jgi:hypothetical protein
VQNRKLARQFDDAGRVREATPDRADLPDAGILQEDNNVLVVNARADDDDRDKGIEVVISDVVIYHKRDI